MDTEDHLGSLDIATVSTDLNCHWENVKISDEVSSNTDAKNAEQMQNKCNKKIKTVSKECLFPKDPVFQCHEIRLLPSCMKAIVHLSGPLNLRWARCISFQVWDRMDGMTVVVSQMQLSIL